MEKKNYEFRAFDSNGKEINLKCANVFFGITEEMAQGIRMGLFNGLVEKYKDPQVMFEEIYSIV